MPDDDLKEPAKPSRGIELATFANFAQSVPDDVLGVQKDLSVGRCASALCVLFFKSSQQGRRIPIPREGAPEAILGELEEVSRG
jgi:hypothetical protein